MFKFLGKIFSKKQEKNTNIIEEDVYTVNIYFKDGKTYGFTNYDCKSFPYRKFYNWYFSRNSESYCFKYNGGMLIFNRIDISRIVFEKQKIKREIEIKTIKKYEI